MPTTVAIEVTSAGNPVSEGQTVSGVLNIKVTVNNGIGKHVQTYGNFIVLPFIEPGHAPDAPVWSHTTTVNTKRFFDGENLISVHAHPHNVAGQPYTTDFTVGTFKIVSENSNPAPNGDRLLPALEFLTTFSTWWQPQLITGGGGYVLSGDVKINDDSGNGQTVERSSFDSKPIQIISHLGESVLGRFRWSTQTPPFGDLNLISNVSLRPFQRDAAFQSRLVFFFNDGAGRANYAFKTFTMPALQPDDRVKFPLPGLDAKILGVGDAGTIRVPDGGSYLLKVRVSNPLPVADQYPEMTTWVGNRSVKVTKLQPYIDAMPEGATSFIVDVPIPAAEIVKLQNARQTGEQTTAFAVWNDFNLENDFNVPTSGHVHVNSVRTVSYPWPYGNPAISILSPWNGSNHWVGSTLDVRYDAWGPIPAGTQRLLQLDSLPEVIDTDSDGRFLFSGIARGTHTLKVRLTDVDGNTLPHTTASASSTFQIVNEPPKAKAERYSIIGGETLAVPAATGVLANDTDLENDPLTALLTSTPTHGTVTLNSDGSFTYTPATDYTGVDMFGYRAHDGFTQSRNMWAVISVKPTGGTELAGDWPTFGGHATHTGQFSGFLSDRIPSLLWTRTFPAGSISSSSIHQVAVADSNVYVTSGYYAYDPLRVYCLSASTGTQIWLREFPKGHSITPPTYADGAIYFQRGNHSSDSQLWSLNAGSGNTNWSVPFSAQWERYFAPTVADGKIWINGGSYGGMYGFAQDTGAKLFFVGLEQFDQWTPTYANGRLFSWVQNNFREHHPSTGAVLSSADIQWDWNGWSMNTVAAVADGRAYLRSTTGLYAVDLGNFKRAWRNVRAGFIGTPATADGLVYALAGNNLEVYHGADGTLLGTVSCGEALIHQPIVTSDAVFVSSTAKTFIIDRGTHNIIHTLPHGGYLSLANNALYVADYVNSSAPKLHRFNLVPPNTPPVIVSAPWATPNPVVLPATTTVSVAASDDGLPNPPSALTYTWSQVSGPGTTAFIPNGTSASANSTATFSAAGMYTLRVTVSDGALSATGDVDVTVNPETLVSIAATDAVAKENSSDTGKFTITRSGDTSAALTVNYSASGTAANGTDYNTLSGSVLIVAGQSSATVTVTSKNDTLVEGIETVVVTLNAGAGYELGTPDSATVQLYDDEVTTVTVASSDLFASEPGSDTGRFTLTRTTPKTSALAVNYTLSGSATNGTDYVSLPGTATFAAGASTVLVYVNPIDDALLENSETVLMAVDAGSGYQVGTSASAIVTLLDNEMPVLSVSATDALASEPGTDKGTIRITRTGGGVSAALTVNYSLSGSAANDADYQSLSGTATIAAGATNVNISIAPLDDAILENKETVTLTLAPDAAYQIGAAPSGTVSILDDEMPIVSISATDNSAAETGGNNGAFTISRLDNSSSAVTVKYTITGTAANGTDYEPVANSITLAAGATSGTITVTAIDDTLAEVNETVKLTLTTDAAYQISSPGSATVTITSNE